MIPIKVQEDILNNYPSLESFIQELLKESVVLTKNYNYYIEGSTVDGCEVVEISDFWKYYTVPENATDFSELKEVELKEQVNYYWDFK